MSKKQTRKENDRLHCILSAARLSFYILLNFVFRLMCCYSSILKIKIKENSDDALFLHTQAECTKINCTFPRLNTLLSNLHLFSFRFDRTILSSQNAITFNRNSLAKHTNNLYVYPLLATFLLASRTHAFL